MTLHFRSALSACALILCSTHTFALNLVGSVNDENKQPIEGAEISIEGTTITAKTDARGRYTITNIKGEHLHLHVYSEDHLHGSAEVPHDIDEAEPVELNFTLQTTRIENVLVRANFLASSVLETVAPVTVLDKADLLKYQSPTLGQSLSKVPGVHGSAFGPVASSPVIRGMNGPRVKVVQNGLDVADASRVGADHGVATDTSTATQVEVLRGPSTLQYGSGAIGGVVNIVDNRIPNTLPDAWQAEVQLRTESVSDESFASVYTHGAIGSLAFSVAGFTRETNDFDIPGFAESEPHEDEDSGLLPNSAIDANSFTLGTSYVGDAGHFGIAYQELTNVYGVPGHAHGEEHEEEEHESLDDEEGVYLDIELNRTQLAGEWLAPINGLDSINYRAAFTDYKHIEFEGDAAGTQIETKTSETIVNVKHRAVNGWHGVIGAHYTATDFDSEGEEAFAPSNSSDATSIYLIEEKRVNNITWQAGARFEQSGLSTVELVEAPHIAHEEGEEPSVEEEQQLLDVPDFDFSSTSVSFGVLWDYADGYQLSSSLSRSERVPSHQELFAAGHHVATGTYDLGLAYVIDGEETEINGDINKETSLNLELGWKKYSGKFTTSAAVFYTQAEGYIFQQNTGLEVEITHDHEEETHKTLPLFHYVQDDATLYGFEIELGHKLNNYWQHSLFIDSIRAETNNDYLPRIPPLRTVYELSFAAQNWDASVSAAWFDAQNNTAQNETPSDSYTTLDAHFTYQLPTNGLDITFFINGGNLTNEEIRPHTSFIKELAPMAGRNISTGVKVSF